MGIVLIPPRNRAFWPDGGLALLSKRRDWPQFPLRPYPWTHDYSWYSDFSGTSAGLWK
jgi:hypothetical protein